MRSEKNKNEFDAVDFMRRVRDKLSAEYYKYPDREEKNLIEIRKKYSIKKKLVG